MGKFTQKIKILFSTLLILPILSGCSISGLDPQALISPPKANADQQQIFKLLRGIRADIPLVYPKNGEHRAAVTMHDFTGNGAEDAVGFYMLETGIEVKFLTKTDSQWQTLSTFKNAASQVDRIFFGDINGDGIEDVLVGWGNTQTGTSAKLSAFIHSNGIITEYPIETPYGEVALTNFFDDDKQEIFLIQRAVLSQDESVDSIQSKADVYAFQDGHLQSVASTKADDTISKFSSIRFGKISPRIKALVLDGTKADSSSNTQVFYLDENQKLINAYFTVNSDGTSPTFSRAAGSSITSRDINLDEILEIPSATLLPAIPSEVTPDSTSFLLNWMQFRNIFEQKHVLYSLINASDGYWFELPSVMAGNITALYDQKLHAVTYSAVVKNEGTENTEYLIGSSLFTIRVFTASAWEQRGQPAGYELLAEQNELIYAIITHTKDATSLRQISRIRLNFKLITE